MGWTSVDDTIPEQFDRYLQISAQVTEYRDEIVAASMQDLQGAEGLLKDLIKLSDRLAGLQQVLSVSLRELQETRDAIERRRREKYS